MEWYNFSAHLYARRWITNEKVLAIWVNHQAVVRSVTSCLRSVFQGLCFQWQGHRHLTLAACGALQNLGMRRGRGQRLVLVRWELGTLQPVQPPSLQRHFHCGLQCVRQAAGAILKCSLCLPPLPNRMYLCKIWCTPVLVQLYSSTERGEGWMAA